MNSRSCLLLGGVLLLLAGCGIPQNEEDGQKEPVLGNYAVTVSPPKGALSLPAITGLAKWTVELKAECLSPIPPDDCGSNVPDWDFISWPFLEVAIANPKSPSTTADITFNASAYFNAHPDNANSIGAPEALFIRFFPNHSPTDMPLYPASGAAFVINLQRPGVPPPQTQQEPDKASLTVTPKVPEGFFVDESDPAPTREITVSYKGPRSKLIVASIEGQGAPAFSINAGIVGFPLPGDGSGPVIFVTGDKKKAFANATLTLKADPPRLSDEASCTAVVYLSP